MSSKALLFLDRIAAQRRSMRRLAAVVALAAVVVPPLVFGVVGFAAQKSRLHLRIEFKAGKLAKYIYVHGQTWRYSEERLVDLLSFAPAFDENVQNRVSTPDGRVVIVRGAKQPSPVLSETLPVLVRGQVVANIEGTTSLRPYLLNVLFAGALGLGLGGAILAVLYRLPLRTLDETFKELQATMNTIEEHATETTYAYDTLERQHRVVEETTQQFMEARNAAEAASRAKSAFLATMSHELRTPLNAIIGFSEMMTTEQLGPIGNPSYRGYCEDILASGLHLLNVINDVLDLSKVEAGKMDLSRKEFDLCKVAAECARLVEGRLVGAGLKFTLEGNGRPLVIDADPVRVRQILLNLLSNAIKFTPRGGRVTMTIQGESDDTVSVCVSDTGIGMDAAEVVRALRPFEQIDNALGRKYDGTGLGLPLAKALMEQHGGRLTVDSSPNQGTTVTIRFFQSALRKLNARRMPGPRTTDAEAPRWG